MDLFIDEARYQALLSKLGQGAASLDERVALCWHQRQRDPAAAQQLARDLLAQPIALSAGDRARLALVRAEQGLLAIQPDAARAALHEAREGFSLTADPEGLADCAWLQALQAVLEGRQPQALPFLDEVRERAGTDSLRGLAAGLWGDLLRTFADPAAGRARGAPGQEAIDALPLGAKAWAHELRGTLAAQRSDYGRAAAERLLACEFALASGQVQRAVVAIHNAADALNNLGAYEQSLHWMERALALVRERAWPQLMGYSLAQLGDTLRRLGRLDAAQEAVQEALALLSKAPTSRPFAIALKCEGDLALDRAEAAAALEAFEQLGRHPQAQTQPDLAIFALRGQAQALSLLDRPEQALACALRALERATASGHAFRQIEALRALASLHTRHPALPCPPGSTAPNAALHHLLQAQALAQTLPGFEIPSELAEALADAWAAAGDMAQAYQLSRAANAARQRSQTELANQRVLAMQALHQTDKARAEAAEQARRADALMREMAQRVQQGKLQALGQLVAGVAHELNTPIGNSMMAASHWQARNEALSQAVQAQALRRSALDDYLLHARQSAELLARNLSRAAALVEQFKQIAVDSTTEARRRFSLRPLCEAALQTCQHEALQEQGLKLELELQIDAGLELDSDPVALQQLLAELCRNARLHAFVGRSEGRLRLQVEPRPGSAGFRLSLSDNGCGIAEADLGRIFEPFFSTRFGQGRSGLGLHVCHNLALARLGGSLSVQSTPGQGTCFVLELGDARSSMP